MDSASLVVTMSLGSGLVPVGVLAADDDVEGLQQRQRLEGELHHPAPLRRHEAESPAVGLEAHKGVLHPAAAAQLGVQRLVVLAVDAEELLAARGIERVHHLLEPRPADGGEELLGRDLARQHRAGRMAHGGEDDLARVDDRAVEIEQEHWEAHRLIGNVLHSQ